jgi:uncharacterized Zn finger protein
MTEKGDRVPLPCPSCSPGEGTVHEVLKPGGHVTVRCTDCGHVHKEKLEMPDEVTIDVVVSQDGSSYKTTLDAVAEEEVEVGDEFVVETPEAIQQVRVTSIEVGPEQRRDEAAMEDVETIWSRVVDNVKVNVTLHPKDGDGRYTETRSLNAHLPGDYEFVVGDDYEFGSDEFVCESIQIRDEMADAYRREKFDHRGDKVFAKDIKRVYGRDKKTTAWSAW